MDEFRFKFFSNIVIPASLSFKTLVETTSQLIPVLSSLASSTAAPVELAKKKSIVNKSFLIYAIYIHAGYHQ